MPDQAGGGNATESLSQETSQQNVPKPILNHAASNKMGGWKNSILQWMSTRSPGMSKGQPINPSQSSKTMAGAADPNVPGGPKEIQALAQNAQAQPQPIANPAGAADNSGKMASYRPTKEASMSQVNPRRVELVRAMLKFAACMKKGKKKKFNYFKKRADEDVPGVSVAAPMTAAGIGAGLGAINPALDRHTILPDLAARGISPARAIARSPDTRALPSEMKRELLRTLSSRLHAYGVRPGVAAATLAGPIWAGAAAAKHEGGAGRGAAVGTGAGAGIGTVAQLIAALVARKRPGGAMEALKRIPSAAVMGAGVGAVGGAIGGGVQKRRRTKAQEKAKSKKKELKGESKEAALKRVLHKRATGAAAAEIAAPAAKWGLRKILGLGALGTLGAGVLGGAAIAGPPIARGLQHTLEYNWGDPMYKINHDVMKKMMSGPMMQMMMMRNMGLGGIGGMGMPPVMNPEDRQMLQHANYLRGLRSRVKAMQEAYEV